MRERLPVLYGLGRTIRLDEFTLKAIGLDHLAQLVNEIVMTEAGDDRKQTAPG
jgi:hypothetical protein